MHVVDDRPCPRPLSVVIAGGGTGGHLFPGIAVAGEFASRHPDSRILFVGAGRPLERDALARAGFPLRTIAIEGIKGRGMLAKLRVLLKIPAAICRSARILADVGADLMVGMGGYAAGPVAVAARMRSIPVVLCEQNTVPGITNRMLLPLARRMYVSFENTVGRIDPRKWRYTGNPVRREIRAAADVGDKRANTFTVLIVGGSQGAHAINMTMVDALSHLQRPERLRIVHQTGTQDCDEVTRAYRQAGVRAEVQAFFHDMAACYRQADVVVCRAGATTVAELTVLGKAAVLIPYPFAADNHQERNAETLVTRGAAIMIRERNLTGSDLARHLEHLAETPDQLAAMAGRSRTLGKPEAAKTIVDDCYQLVGDHVCT